MSLSKELIEEIKSVRTNPSSYADKIIKYKEYFDGKILKIPGGGAGIDTLEGAPSYEEAANFLKGATGVDPLIPSKGLTKISKEFINNALYVGFDRLDHIDINKIIDKFGTFIGEINQLIELGSKTPEQVVISLLVCDGDSSRSYRNNLLNPNFKKIGIATGKNEIYENCTVIFITNEFKSKDELDDTENFDENENDSEKLNQNVTAPLMTLSDMLNPDKGNEEAGKRGL